MRARPAAAKSGRRAAPAASIDHPRQERQARIRQILRGGAVQRAPAIGAADDPFEQEAERVAHEVLRAPEPASELHRRPLEGESDAGTSAGIIPGAGSPLPESERGFFEPRLGYDLGAVRIHTGARAAATARILNARAFTLGRHVVFGAGQYAPGAGAGRHLLAHELTHVVQQQCSSAASLQRLSASEKAENLQSGKYAGQRRLEKAFDNDPALGIGESGEGVRRVQEGLVADGFAMPLSTKATGELDGGFGDETFTVVKQFQAKHGLAIDGVVGRETLGKLDELAVAAPCVFPVGIFNGPHHEPLDTQTHAGMLIDITVLASTGRPADLQGVQDSEQVSQSFDHQGSFAGVAPIGARTSAFQPAADVPPDQHVILKAFVIDRVLNHGGNGALSVHQLDVFRHPRCGVAAPAVVPLSGHRVDIIATRRPAGGVELTVRKRAEKCTVNGFTAEAGPSLTHADTVLIKPDDAAGGCTPDAGQFEVTAEQLFANPSFDFEFSGGDRPSISTRAPSAPFRWNASVKTRGPVQQCFEVGFLQTLRSAFQSAVYDAQTGSGERFCLVIVPTPIRDAKPGAPAPWYSPPMRLGFNCFPEVVLPPGITGNVDQTTVELADNPFSRWCLFLGAQAQSSASDCGLSGATFRLNTLVETLAFDAWLVLRPRGNADTSCFTFLRHASWMKNVHIVMAAGVLGFLKRDLGVTLLDHGDGIGSDAPELGAETARTTVERVCLDTTP